MAITVRIPPVVYFSAHALGLYIDNRIERRIVRCVRIKNNGYGTMDKYYDNAENSAAFDRCIDVMAKLILKYGNRILENLPEEERKAA